MGMLCNVFGKLNTRKLLSVFKLTVGKLTKNVYTMYTFLDTLKFFFYGTITQMAFLDRNTR